MIEFADINDNHGSLRARLWMVSATVVSLVVTAWLCTLGPVPAVLAVVVEKHVLVAILVMRLDVEQRPDESPPPASPSAY